MKYTLNPLEFCDMFAIPKSVCTDHLKLAGTVQLKVLLVLLSGGNVNRPLNEVAGQLNININDAKDAINFWLERGIIVDCESNTEINNIYKEQSPPPATSTDEMRIKDNLTNIIVAAKPTRDDVSNRIENDNKILFLMHESEVNIARLLSENDKSTLLWLHDYKDIPIEVILMVIQYCVSINKSNIKYIEKTAINWAEEDINSVYEAENKINQLKIYNNAWGVVGRCMGLSNQLPSKKQLDYAYRWVCLWNFSTEMLKLAYDACLDSINVLKLPYIDKILDSWHMNNIKSKAKLDEFLTANKTEKSQNSSTKSSLNIKKLEELID